MAALTSVGLFSSCTQKELAAVARLVEDVRVESGTRLFREGDVGDDCYVVVSGFAVATREGREIGSVGPGVVVGEMALIDRAPRFATVTATTPMQLLRLRGPQFWELVDSFPSVNRKVIRSLAQRVRAAEKTAVGEVAVL